MGKLTSDICENLSQSELFERISDMNQDTEDINYLEEEVIGRFRAGQLQSKTEKEMYNLKLDCVRHAQGVCRDRPEKLIAMSESIYKFVLRGE
jgi:hypothetical protein